jgi:hypothetical protein
MLRNTLVLMLISRLDLTTMDDKTIWFRRIRNSLKAQPELRGGWGWWPGSLAGLLWLHAVDQKV